MRPCPSTQRDYCRHSPAVSRSGEVVRTGRAVPKFSPTSTQDIESIVDPRALNVLLPTAVVHTADALRLKAPPGPVSELNDNEAIVVRLARNERDMRECLHLRFQVYDRLGYLEERISNCPAELEMDCYDNRAIQFLAQSTRTDHVVGTVRLLLPQPLPATLPPSVIGSSPCATVEVQARLCRQIALAEAKADARNVALADKLNEGNFAPLPILQSNDFREKTSRVLGQAKFQVELSRLVVWPRYRGLKISHLLIRAVVAVAHDLRRDIVLLECVPAHVPMYENFGECWTVGAPTPTRRGFERIQGQHGRAQDLDQVAVAMKLELTPCPLDHAASIANRDLEMIRFGPRFVDAVWSQPSSVLVQRQKLLAARRLFLPDPAVVSAA